MPFPSTTHLIHCTTVPTRRTKVNTVAHGTEANNKHPKFDLSLDDHCSTGPWEACMYQTPD